MNPDYSRAIPLAWAHMSKVFTALGDEHRQRILLTFEPGERLNVGQIAEVSTLSRSAVSHHLKILREAGITSTRPEGMRCRVSLRRMELNRRFPGLLAAILKNAE